MKRKNLADVFGSNPWGVKSQIFGDDKPYDHFVGIDAGGTKTLAAHLDAAGRKPGSSGVALGDLAGLELYDGDKYNSIMEIIGDYLAKNAINPEKTCLCIAGAGPVKNNSIEMTNRAWSIHAGEIERKFRFKRIYLLNDLEVMIYAVDSIDADHLETIQHGKKMREGNVAVIAAGTGLGESLGIYLPSKNARVAVATEGGNTDFAPGNDLEIELLKNLLTRKNHASWEDILSGNGFTLLYDFLIQTGLPQNEETAAEMRWKNTPEVVTSRGLSGADPVCRRVLEIFASIYAAEAANLALKSLAYGGLYIAGGIAPRILPMLQEKAFIDRFVAKGKMSPLLESIPVYVVKNPNYGVIGAINFALLHGAE